jgi:predicted enzyme related to lactoylglutathione lyase
MAAPGWSTGMFVWRELVTQDVEAARRFLGELFGWSWQGMDMGPAGTYWIASAGDRQVGGLMRTPQGMAIPSAWTSYVLVDGVDAAAARAGAAGGKVLVPPTDIPNVGRFAVVADRWGAVLNPFVPSNSGDAPPPGPPAAGTFCWETLVTPDAPGAIAWYGRVIGFGSAPSPTGQGSVFTAGGNPVADVQAAGAGAPSYWATYVAVDDAMATRDRVAGLGGRVLVPRIDVPTVGTVAVVADPSGAALGIFQPGRQG